MAKSSLWQRFGATTGIIYVLLSIIALSLVPPPPATGAAVSDIVAYYKIHNGLGYLIPSYIQQFGLLFLLYDPVGAVSGQLRAEGEAQHLSTIVFGAGVAVVTILLAFGAVSITLPLRTDDPALIQALSDLVGIGLVTYFLPAAVLVAAASIAILRTGVMARWLGILGLAVVVVQLLGSLSLVITSGPFAAAGLFSILAYLGFLVWMLAASIVLMVKGVSVRQQAESVPAMVG